MYLPAAEVMALKTASDSAFSACTALLSIGSPIESKRVPVNAAGARGCAILCAGRQSR